MHREIHGWHSDRLGRHMNVIVHGHWGPPMILFPTSGGDEGEYERQSLIGAIAEHLDAGRVKTFSVNVNHSDSFANKGAHPLHRSWMQRQYDAYIRHEVIPFVRDHCRSNDTAVWTMGASLGGYHAANTLFKYPDVVKRCYALSHCVATTSAARVTPTSSRIERQELTAIRRQIALAIGLD